MPSARSVLPSGVGVVWHSAPVSLPSADPSLPDAAQAAVARAMAREVAVHEAYDRARNTLRARARRQALTPLAREMFSSPGRLDAYASRSMPSWAWGVPVSRSGHVVAIISPTSSAISPQIRSALGPLVIVVASWDEQERIRRVTESRQRFALLSVRTPEPTHEEIVDFARRHPVAATPTGTRGPVTS